MIITYQQALSLVKYFECEDDPTELEYVLVDSSSYPDFKGQKGLYCYHAEYPREGLMFLGSK